MQYYAKILCNTILCNCIFSKYTLHSSVVVCVCLGLTRGFLSMGLIAQGAYSLGGFSPKGGFVQGAYISGGL